MPSPLINWSTSHILPEPANTIRLRSEVFNDMGSFYRARQSALSGAKPGLGIGGRNYGLPGDVLATTINLIFLNGFENAP